MTLASLAGVSFYDSWRRSSGRIIRADTPAVIDPDGISSTQILSCEVYEQSLLFHAEIRNLADHRLLIAEDSLPPYLAIVEVDGEVMFFGGGCRTWGGQSQSECVVVAAGDSYAFEFSQSFERLSADHLRLEEEVIPAGRLTLQFWIDESSFYLDDQLAWQQVFGGCRGTNKITVELNRP